jgi:hypothetical protein
MSTLQRPVPHLCVSTPQGFKLHPGVPSQQESVHAAPGRVYATWPELHLDVTTLERIVLHLDVSKPQGPESLQWLLEFDIADLILFSSLLFFFYIVKFFT